MKKYINPPGKIGEIVFPELLKFKEIYGSLTVVARPLPLMSLDLNKLKTAETFDATLLQSGFVYFVLNERTTNVIGVLVVHFDTSGACKIDSFIPDQVVWASIHGALKEVLDYCEIVSPFPGVYAVLLRNKKEKIESVYVFGQAAGAIDLKEYVRQLKTIKKFSEADKSSKLIKVLSSNKKKSSYKKAVA